MSNGDDQDVNIDGITADAEVFIENPQDIGVGIIGDTATESTSGHTPIIKVGIIGKTAVMLIGAFDAGFSDYREYVGLVLRNYDRSDLETEVDFWAFINPDFWKLPDEAQRA
jgi:hypothetical protein